MAVAEREATGRELLPAAIGAYLESFDRLLRASDTDALIAADQGMARSMDLICEVTGITPRYRPRRLGTIERWRR